MNALIKMIAACSVAAVAGAVATFIATNAGEPETYADCVIENAAGVGSEATARLIASACREAHPIGWDDVSTPSRDD